MPRRSATLPPAAGETQRISAPTLLAETRAFLLQARAVGPFPAAHALSRAYHSLALREGRRDPTGLRRHDLATACGQMFQVLALLDDVNRVTRLYFGVGWLDLVVSGLLRVLRERWPRLEAELAAGPEPEWATADEEVNSEVA